MLRGISTVVFTAEDLSAARRFYSELLGIEPYFVREGYVEYRLGDLQTELGIMDARFAAPGHAKPGGAFVYWAVDDLDGQLATLHRLGATTYDEPTDRGEGFVTASVLDPFGNLLGLMTNPHYHEQLAAYRG